MEPPYTSTKCPNVEFPATGYFTAVGDALWDNGAACGQMYRLRCFPGPNNPCVGGIRGGKGGGKAPVVEVKVVDYRPGTAFSLNKKANAEIQRGTGKINVDYVKI